VSEKQTNLSEYITENFGANANYVEGLLNRFMSDPNLVDESWRTYFNDLLNGGATSTAASGNGQQSNATATQAAPVPASETQSAAINATAPVKPATVAVGAETEVKAITGAEFDCSDGDFFAARAGQSFG
jgi:2-oxoglutarate dehydrogenase complex dehydrogenase (E1) component-like enzyme